MMMGMPAFLRDRLDTPVGELLLVADLQGRLCGVGWTDREDRLIRDLRLCHRIQPTFEDCDNPGGLSAALQAYFAGDLTAIDPLAVNTGGTPFQREVWSALRHIPCGSTLTYAELAHRIGRPSAVRAVGHANGANPVSVVVPCHRLVGAGGALTGYGGGLERKRWLLQHEGATSR
jgi:methylated-DNA-[protein]-cysteine S-methyltransferase